ncbi:Vitamin K-dependent protein [Trichinella pseudospiralis]
MPLQINTQIMAENIGKSRLCRDGIAFTCVLENDFNSVNFAKSEYGSRHGLSKFSLFTASECINRHWQLSDSINFNYPLAPVGVAFASARDHVIRFASRVPVHFWPPLNAIVVVRRREGVFKFN